MAFPETMSAFQAGFPGLLGGLVAFFFIKVLYTKLMAHKKGSDIGIPRLDQLSEQIKSGSKACVRAPRAREEHRRSLRRSLYLLSFYDYCTSFRSFNLMNIIAECYCRLYIFELVSSFKKRRNY